MESNYKSNKKARFKGFQRILKCFSICFLVTCLIFILFTTVLGASTISNSTIVYISNSKTVTIGKWELPWPLDKYRIDLYATPSFSGSNTISWSIDKDLISPGETLTLTINLEKGMYSYRIDFRVIVIIKSTGEALIDKTVGINLGPIEVPGSWSSKPLTVPVIPLEFIDIPAELSIFFSISIITRYSITLSTYGLQPQFMTLDFVTSESKSNSLSKTLGVGAEAYLMDAIIKTQASISVSAGLSVVKIPTPLKIDFATVPIEEWITSSAQNINMFILKTPVMLEVSLTPSLINLGDSAMMIGHVIPPAEDLPIQVLVEEMVVDNVRTMQDGTFSIDLRPEHFGIFRVYAKLPETKYTTAATSITMQLIVNSPPKPSFTCSPTNPIAGQEIHFIDTSSDPDGNIVTWLWDFGDGSTSVEKNPIHIYASSGAYTIKLTVKDNYGSENSFSTTITVENPPSIIMPTNFLPQAFIILFFMMIGIAALVVVSRTTRKQPKAELQPVATSVKPPEILYCVYCGAKNYAGRRYCNNCGKELFKGE